MVCAMKKYLALLAFMIACDSPTGSTCPPSDPPTYEGFARPFMETYCLDCHSTHSTNRHDAPGDQNFDTEADLARHAAAIDSEAAAGPDATNTSMPELSQNVRSKPSVEERQLLGQYLACLQAQP